MPTGCVSPVNIARRRNSTPSVVDSGNGVASLCIWLNSEKVRHPMASEGPNPPIKGAPLTGIVGFAKSKSARRDCISMEDGVVLRVET